MLRVNISQWSETWIPHVNLEDWNKISSHLYHPTFYTFTISSLCSLSVQSKSAGHAMPVMWCLNTQHIPNYQLAVPVTWCFKLSIYSTWTQLPVYITWSVYTQFLLQLSVSSLCSFVSNRYQVPMTYLSRGVENIPDVLNHQLAMHHLSRGV